jgi:hypothetical protein
MRQTGFVLEGHYYNVQLLKQEHTPHSTWLSNAQCQSKILPHLKIRFTMSSSLHLVYIMFTPARDFLLETPWRIIIPNPNVNSHFL